MKTYNRQKLIELRELFSDPSRHTTGEFARTAQGSGVHALSPAAVCWCLIGGAIKVSDGDLHGSDSLRACLRNTIPFIFPEKDGLRLDGFNDRYPEKVLELIDRTIESLN